MPPATSGAAEDMDEDEAEEQEEEEVSQRYVTTHCYHWGL